MTFIIECKNLIGDIEIDSEGNFIRNYEFNGKRIREGIYSPITQNQRHLEVLKQIVKNAKSNTLMKMMVDRFFHDNYKSIVVLANPKTLLNAKNAKKEIKEKVIRADQLIQYIKDVYSKSKNPEDNDSDLKAWAEGLQKLHKPSQSDYAKKYEEINNNLGISNEVSSEEKQDAAREMKGRSTEGKGIIDEDLLLQNLKSFRLERCKEEKIKPYYIFNDKQLKDLIEKMPDSKASLLKVSGFGEVKVEKYGEKILEILNDFGKN
ncbi:MAG: helicase [Firmicutes bacterium HGW-Firmicutes-14]|nr:MAG: helicase [Firmicutes bacterium HGW-Firmicutes-14]